MADRRSLLDTGKSIGESVAGTFKSAAGTLADKGGHGVDRARSVAGTLGDRASAVQGEFAELTDETVTPEEQERIERASDEARDEVQQTGGDFGREFAENLWMEAYDMELQEQQSSQRQQQQRQQRQAPQEQNPREAQWQNTMAFGGFAPPSQGQTQDPPAQVEQLFGVSSRGRDESEQVAPLFGLRY